MAGFSESAIESEDDLKDEELERRKFGGNRIDNISFHSSHIGILSKIQGFI